MERIFADANATYGLLPEVRDLLRFSADFCYLNGSSVHSEGQRVRAQLDEARSAVLDWTQLSDSEIQVVFTSGATESINHATFYSFLGRGDASPFGEVVTSAVEHSAGNEAVDRLSSFGAKVTKVRPSTNGQITVQSVLNELTENTKLLSLIWANNETGIVYPIPEIFREVRKQFPKCLLHTDAVQMVSKREVSLSSFPFDFLTIGPHKFGALPGVGISLIHKRLELHPLIVGGAQELKWRPGTENVLGILSCGCAIRELPKLLLGYSERVLGLRDRFETSLLEKGYPIEVIGQKAERLPNTSLIRIAGHPTDDLIVALDLSGVSCSRGSACSSGKQLGSHVLQGMGYSEEAGKEVVRFSFRADFDEKSLNLLLERFFSCFERFQRTTNAVESANLLDSVT